MEGGSYEKGLANMISPDTFKAIDKSMPTPGGARQVISSEETTETLLHNLEPCLFYFVYFILFILFVYFILFILFVYSFILFVHFIRLFCLFLEKVSHSFTNLL